MNIIRKYWDSAATYILLLIPCLTMTAGTFFTVFKLVGYYPDMAWIKLLIFDSSQLLYLAIAIWIIIQNKKKPSFFLSHLFQIKCYVTIILFIQYNFILHLFPSQFIWEDTFLFLAIWVLFFDSKMYLISAGISIISLLIAHFIHPEDLLPLRAPNLPEVITFRITILALTVFLVYIIVYFSEHFLIQAQAEQKENAYLLSKQVEYYQNTDLLDTELRKFRHDIKNHFACMQYLLDNGNTEELSAYFQDLQQSFPSQDKLYSCGNLIIDAILNYDIPHFCSKQVQIRVHGLLPQIETVSSIDLCTLFSNLLTNAINAANQCSSYHQPPWLNIHFQSGTHYFSITVSNSTREENTNKPNRNHGYGLNKINEIVKKYNGELEHALREKQFDTIIYLPI